MIKKNTLQKAFFSISVLTILLGSTFINSSCARRLNSTFNSDDNVRRTDIPKTVFKNQDHTIKYKSLNKDTINITYLGCGGFSIMKNGKIVLIDPFFTNPDFVFKASGLIKMKTKTDKVDSGMAKIPSYKNENVAAILVSHSHYDHLMDVPYVFEKFANTSKTKLYCSQSSKNMINGVGEIIADKITTLNYKTSSANSIGEQFYLADSSIRITPILTEHAPHMKNIKMYKGDAKPKHRYTEPSDRSRAGWWKEGETYAFLIDYFSADTLEFRIYIQSSAASPQNGWLAPRLKAEKTVDLALLGIASFDFVDHYPESLIDHLEPEKLVICHWEDFFKKYDRKTPKRVRLTKVHEAIRRIDLVYPYEKDMKKDQFIFPYPGVTISCKH